MIAKVRLAVLGLTLLVGAVADGPAAEPDRAHGSRGACYCRMADTLQCTANLTEPECRRRCNEAICDDWFWKDRLACWNWGYGG